ncbi:MAG: Rieske (2Fe-2S) protein [Steroidobacterales bacterium]
MAREQRLIFASDDLRDSGKDIRFEVRAGGASRPAFAIRWCGNACSFVNECRHRATKLDWECGDFFDAAKLYLLCATHGATHEPDSGLWVAEPCRGARPATVAVAERQGAIYCIED